jgi:hypothetical protein
MSAPQQSSKGPIVEPAAEDAVAASPTCAPSNSSGELLFNVASHAELFIEPEEEACDVCGEAVAEDSDEGFAVPGRGLYVWSRGDELRIEEPALCPSCASAVGVSALARWEIEEEEG